MEEHFARLKEHLASQNKTIASLEKNSALKDDIITALRKTIVDMENQITELKELNTLHVQIREAQGQLIAQLHGSVAEPNDKFAVRECGDGDKGKKAVCADPADMHFSITRDFQPLQGSTRFDESSTGPSGARNHTASDTYLPITRDFQPLRQPTTPEDSSTRSNGTCSYAASDTELSPANGVGKTSTTAEHTDAQSFLLVPDGTASAAQETSVGDGVNNGKGKGLFERWKSLRSPSSSAGPSSG